MINGDGGRERTPLSKARWGGIRRVAHPRDPTSASAADAAYLLFFPPALSFIHPALYLSASILVLPSSSSTSRDGYHHPPCLSSHLRRRHISPPPPSASIVVD